MIKIVLASNNSDKLKEIKEIVPQSYNLINAREIDPDVDWDEVGKTFQENALIKALAVKAILPKGKYAILAEDSGLCVDALNGSPGIYSARYSGENGDHKANNKKLLKEMSNIEDNLRQAYYVCSLVYIDEKGDQHNFESKCHGSISRSIKGEEGFGYDPLFIPLGESKTLSELGKEFKNKISHRLKSLDKWVNHLNSIED